MKKLLIILFLPLLIIQCKNSEKSSDNTTEDAAMERNNWANAHLNGKVKSIEETPYTPDESGKISEMDSCCVELKEYSDKGFIMKYTEKNKEGTVTQVNVMEHSETGKFISNTRFKNGKEVWKRVVNRDEEGNPLGAFDSDSTQQVTRIHKGEVYNDFNQPVSGKTYTSDSTYLGTWSYKYIDGLRAGYSWIDSANVQRINRTGEVNDKGWISKVVDVRVEENGDTTTTSETYTYDSFDEMGNWTQRTEYIDQKPVHVMKRSYTYHQE
jgi:hypothetical protein